MKKRVFKYLILLFLVYVIVWSTVFIARPVQLPQRTVQLGYPVSFVTLDFSTPTTPMGGAPDSFLKRNKFNITASWENTAEVSRSRFMLSYVLVFLAIYGLGRIIGKAILRKPRSKALF